MQSKGIVVGRMWLFTLDGAFKFPEVSSAALGRGLSDGAGGRGQESGFREGWNKELLQARKQDKTSKKKMRSHIFQLSDAATAITSVPVPPSMPTLPKAHVKAHLAASPNKVWQGLAGVGRLLREEGDMSFAILTQISQLFLQQVIDVQLHKEGLGDSFWRYGSLSSLPLPQKIKTKETEMFLLQLQMVSRHSEPYKCTGVLLYHFSTT